jgi:hypothetical protein
MKRYSPAGRRNYGRPFEETSGYVRPERVNKWPNSVTRYMRMMMIKYYCESFESCVHLVVKITEIPCNTPPPHFFKTSSTLYEYTNAEK